MNRIVTFDQDIVKVGRIKTAHLHIQDPNLSRMHCVIERNGSAFEIIDLGSSTGTWVNEAQVNKAPLKKGDVIRLGAFRLFVL